MELAETGKVCQYSAAHVMAGVPAVHVLDCGVVGMVPACLKCSVFYRKLQTQDAARRAGAEIEPRDIEATTDGELLIDGMPVDQWIEAMTMD